MRKSGIFLHITQLPSPHGCGAMGKSSYEFVDFLRQSGQKIWQILPLTHTNKDGYYSPYQSYSAMAGNPMLIDLDMLVEDGYLTSQDVLDNSFISDPHRIDFEKVQSSREILFEIAFKNKIDISEFSFKNSWWLDDYCEFMHKKEGKSREYYKFIQYLFFEQWHKLKRYANDNNVEIFGDIPMYVSYDSCDVFFNPQLFLLDGDAKKVAGVPPDAFSPLGQKWGNPLYDWDYLEKTDYSWWILRMKHAFDMYDIVRIDHFRAFDEYYAFDYCGRNGKWEKGPGKKIIDAFSKHFKNKKIIAEDLGEINDSVRSLLAHSGYPGMKVLQFAFNSDCNNLYLPHNHNKNAVVYTGTHDNNTTCGYLRETDKQYAISYLNLDKYEKYTQGFINAALSSVCDYCIIPMADWLDLDQHARLNTPGTVGNHNWTHRFIKEQFYNGLANEISHLTGIYGRI